MLLFFLLHQDLICDDYIEYIEATVWLGRKVSSQQKREVCGRQHGFDYTFSQREGFEPRAYINHILYLSPFLGVFFVISVVSLFVPVSSTFSTPVLSQRLCLFGLANTAHTTYHILINVKRQIMLKVSAN